MLKSIKVQNFKSLKNINITLSSLCVLIGPNDSGKSNLLDAMQLISRIGTCRSLKDAFDPPFRGRPMESFTYGDKGIESIRSRESVSFLIEIDVSLSRNVMDTVNKLIRDMKRTQKEEDEEPRKGAHPVHHKDLRYRVEVEMHPQTGVLRMKNEYIAALNSKCEPRGDRSPFLEKIDNKLRLRMEGQSHPMYRDQHLDRSILQEALYAPHYPHMTALKMELENWRFFYFEPRQKMRAPNSVREVNHVGLMGEDLATFLNTLKAKHPRQFQNMEKSLHTVIPSITGIHLDVNKLGEVELSLKQGNSIIPANVVSEGTLRILGLFALSGVDSPPSLIGFEEPENGIHPDRIELVVDRLQSLKDESQVIVTSHSPLIPKLIQEDCLFICRKEHGETVINPFRSPGDIFFENEISRALSG